MFWSKCITGISDSRIALSRFGHSAAAVEASDWGSSLVVVYGGVGSHGSDPSSPQTALSDVIVLHVDRGVWTAPEVVGPAVPGPRAFHCSAAVGRYVYVFGGHILSFDPDARAKKRTFFNDMWRLDTVSCTNCYSTMEKFSSLIVGHVFSNRWTMPVICLDPCSPCSS